MTSGLEPAEEQVSAIIDPPPRWRRITAWSVGIIALAGLIGVSTWWNVTANSIQLEQGSYLTAPGSWHVTAGGTDEYCFEVVPGGAITFGMSFDNPSSHPIHITSVELAPPMTSFQPSVSMRRIDWRSSDPEGGPLTPFAPLTLRKDDEVMFNFTLSSPSTQEFFEGTHAEIGAIQMQYDVMGVQFDKQVPIGYWIGLDRPLAGQSACQPARM